MSNWLRKLHEKLYDNYKYEKREFKNTSRRLVWKDGKAVYDEVDDKDNIQNQSYMSPQKLINHGGLGDFKAEAGEVQDLTIYDRKSLGNTLNNIKNVKINQIADYLIQNDILAEQQKLQQEINPVELTNSNTDGPK